MRLAFQWGWGLIRETDSTLLFCLFKECNTQAVTKVALSSHGICTVAHAWSAPLLMTHWMSCRAAAKLLNYELYIPWERAVCGSWSVTVCCPFFRAYCWKITIRKSETSLVTHTTSQSHTLSTLASSPDTIHAVPKEHMYIKCIHKHQHTTIHSSLATVQILHQKREGCLLGSALIRQISKFTGYILHH